MVDGGSSYDQSLLPSQQRVMAIHDMSCMGRCSLTVAIPVLSAFGLMAAPLPTALLSTHTGEFEGYTYCDLTDEMRGILHHWDTLGLTFQGIYSGFLGSEAQISLVGDVLSNRRQEALIMVDPVMGDQGEVYTTYTPAMVDGMGVLCRQADVMTPNLTEAFLLLNEPYCHHVSDEAVAGMLEKLLHRFGCRYVAVTGVHRKGVYGSAVMSAEDGQMKFAGSRKEKGVYYGTGDLYASLLMGLLMKHHPLEFANQKAVHIVSEAIRLSGATGLPLRYGVPFELLMKEIACLG